MKKFQTYSKEVIVNTDKDLIELALESGIFDIKSREEEESLTVGRFGGKSLSIKLDEWGQLSYYDAPYALVMKDEEKVGGYLKCWGLDERMSLQEALKDFDHLEEQRIFDILDACNIEYKIKEVN
jgi:hypothetical protein